MSYSRTQQFDLLGKLGVQQPDWADLGRAVVLLMAAAALAGAAWAWWDRHRQDPWQRLLGRVRQRLATLGVDVQAHHGPHTLAERARQQLGPPAEPLAAELQALAELRYGRHAQRLPQRGWWRRFQAAAKALAAARAPG
jgi:hypothetical protein